MKNRKKNCRCQTKQSDTSQQKDKQKMKKLNCVNKQFSKENNTDTNVCADNPNTTVQKISNGSISKILNSHDFSNSNTYKLEEYCTAYQYDKLSNVGQEEGEDMCKVSSETLFSDHKDIDYHLVKSVKIEQDFDCNSRENDSSIHNLDTPVFNISDTCTSNDRPSLTTKHIHPKIKEEEVSIINESIITIELQPVSKIEELPDIREIKRTVLDESCSDKLPDNCNEGIETKNVSNAHKPLKATEAVKREMETNLQLQNEVQTLNWSSQSERQIKLETNTRDYDATVREDEYVNELCVADENMQLNSKNNEMCQNQSSTNSKPTIDRPYVYEVCKVCKGFNQLCHRKVCRDLHTGERLFDCTVCGRAFKTQSNLTAHKRIHTGEKPFGCSICGKVFLRQDALTIHKRIHTGDRPFSCTVCGKVFTHHYILTAHKRVHTGDRPFVCTVCGKAFTHHSILTGHKRIHTGEKPFECTICGKTFTRLCGLTGHKRIHTGEKPFGCTICGKAFILQCQLSRHKHTHTGEKPFGCTICGKAFTEMCYLKQHKRIHTGERPFVCTVCGKAFTARHVLTRHKRIHTGEKPFGCSICGKVYRYMESLTNHSKREHT